jgi:hypothetical protein
MTHETSLSTLSSDDWQILRGRWARGIDWVVSKVGRRWALSESFGNFPLFKTKSAAYEAASNLILAESAHRASRA